MIRDYKRTTGESMWVAVKSILEMQNLSRPFFLSEELCAYLLETEDRLYGLSTKDLKALAYQLALKTNKANPFNAEK